MRLRGVQKRKVACVFALLFSVACEDDAHAPGFESAFDPSLTPLDAGRKPRDAAVGGDGATDAGAGGDAASVIEAGFNVVDDASLLASDARAQEGANLDTERLLVVEANSARVHAFDVASQKEIGMFELSGPARVYAGSTGRVGYIAPAGASNLFAIDMGLARRKTSAGEQAELLPPRLLDKELSGSQVQAPVSSGGKTALFFPNEARAVAFDESTLLERFAPVQLAAGGAHAGTAVAWNDGYLVSTLEPGQTDAVLAWHDTNGVRDVSRTFDCVAPNAAARNQNAVAISCRNGVLRWLANASAPVLVPYPAATEQLQKLVAHPKNAAFFARAGDRLCALQETITCVQSSVPVLDIAIDGTGTRALVLRRDGSLQTYEPFTLKALGSMVVTSAVAAGTAEHAWPALAVSRLHLYVTDPLAQRVRTVQASEPREVSSFELPFAPSGLAHFHYVQ